MAFAATLTERQRQVAALLIAGLSNKKIAKELSISEGTVKSHVNAIYTRLGIRSRDRLRMLAQSAALAQ